MRPSRNTTVEVRCPECDEVLEVSVSPPSPMLVDRGGGADPPEPAMIEEILSPQEWVLAPGWWNKVRQAVRCSRYYFYVAPWLGWPQSILVDVCPHTEVLLDDDRFYEEVMRVLEDRYQDEIEARYDRWREKEDQ